MTIEKIIYDYIILYPSSVPLSLIGFILFRSIGGIICTLSFPELIVAISYFFICRVSPSRFTLPFKIVHTWGQFFPPTHSRRLLPYLSSIRAYPRILHRRICPGCASSIGLRGLHLFCSGPFFSALIFAPTTCSFDVCERWNTSEYLCGYDVNNGVFARVSVAFMEEQAPRETLDGQEKQHFVSSTNF